MKICGKCHIEKDESEFYNRGMSLRGSCKKCISEQNRNRTAYINSINRASKNYYQKNADSVSDYYVLLQLKKAGINVSLAKQYPEIIALKRSQLLVSRIKKHLYGKTNKNA